MMLKSIFTVYGVCCAYICDSKMINEVLLLHIGVVAESIKFVPKNMK